MTEPRFTFSALVIPVEGPVYEITLANDNDELETLQRAVGGYIEALPLPDFIDPDEQATAYINEDGKYVCIDDDGKVEINRRATDFMVPGVGLFMGDYIAGPFVVTGFNPATGKTAKLPASIVRRVRLIESEAA